MAADLGYVYDLRTNHVFLEHKCNFRLDLMYYKSLLITPVVFFSFSEGRKLGAALDWNTMVIGPACVGLTYVWYCM